MFHNSTQKFSKLESNYVTMTGRLEAITMSVEITFYVIEYFISFLRFEEVIYGISQWS